MLIKILSGVSLGLGSQIVEVEVDVSNGFPTFEIIGLGDKSIEEAKERVKLAIKNSGLKFPSLKRIIINLAPADIKKEGPIFDLPIALGILLASNEVSLDIFPKNYIFAGELSLNGDLRHTKGILPLACLVQEKKLDGIFLPQANLKEANLVQGIKIFPLTSLKNLLAHLSKAQPIQEIIGQGVKIDYQPQFEIDFSQIQGQEQAKRALEIVAAGNHNILFAGPPGAGKTLLAKALPSILPKMMPEEVLEVSKIYSVSGLLSEEKPFIVLRPVRAPHHTISDIGLIGGGQTPKPGEISLSHRGVLFLDELPEFSRHVLEVLRQPLEDGEVTISRARGSLTFPAKFIFLSSENPCPCGWFGDPKKECRCSSAEILRYHKKISGPLLDRIDLYLEVPRMSFDKIVADKNHESSKEIRQRVEMAREKQRIRFSAMGGSASGGKGTKIMTNAEISSKEIKKICQVSQEAEKLLKEAVDRFYLSVRAYHRILKVARTIADLADEEKITPTHIAEAIQYRVQREKDLI